MMEAYDKLCLVNILLTGRKVCDRILHEFDRVIFPVSSYSRQQLKYKSVIYL